MKDTGTELRKWYYDQLSGMTFLASVAVPVYDHVPFSETYPYILLADNFQTAVNDKDQDLTLNSFEVQVVTHFQKNEGGKLQADGIAEQIFDQVANQTGTTTTFTILTSSFESSNYLETITDTGILIRKIIKFNHILQEL